jgi:transposase
MARLIVAKCCDSIPFYRIKKQFKRLGVPMARSTMTSLFHCAGELLEPLAARLIAHIAQSDIVLADETTERMQASGGKRACIWTFISNNLIAYRFSPSRSGKTPADVLGGTRGTLVVDMYTGYNAAREPNSQRAIARARNLLTPMN